MEDIFEGVIKGILKIIMIVIVFVLFMIVYIAVSVIISVIIRSLLGLIGLVFFLPYNLLTTKMNSRAVVLSYWRYRKKNFDAVYIDFDYGFTVLGKIL